MNIENLDKETAIYKDMCENLNPTKYTEGYRDGLLKAQELVKLCNLQNVVKRFSWSDFFIGLIAGIFATIVLIGKLL